MVESVYGFSKNIDISFKRVHEDINKLKRGFSSLGGSIDDLSSQNIELISIIQDLKNKYSKNKTIPAIEPKKDKAESKAEELVMPDTSQKKKLSFYDVKEKKKFETEDYREVIKNKTLFAVTKSPSGEYDCYRIIKKVK